MNWTAKITYKHNDTIKKSEFGHFTLHDLLVHYVDPIVYSHGEENMLEIHISRSEKC